MTTASTDFIDPTAGTSQARNSAPQVLIVEDNDINRALASEILEFLGFVVRVAVNGEEALQAVRRQSFDLILMDCQMPILDGYETTRRIREAEKSTDHCKIPIIALSGHPAWEGREKCIAAGMDDYLSKPFTVSELQKIIQKWIPSSGT